MCQRVPAVVHAAWMESLTRTIDGTHGTERVNSERTNIATHARAI